MTLPSYPYRAVQAETGFRSDNFIEGTTIEKVVKLYRYDQELRAVTGLQLAKIEITLRAMIGHELGRVDPYLHLSPHKLEKKLGIRLMRNQLNSMQSG